MDSTRWQQEQGRQESGRGGSPYAHKSHKVSRHPDDSLVAYQDSRTHAARQHWGPSQAQEAAAAYEPPRQPASRPQQSYTTAQHTQPYATGDQHYTTTPTTAYGTSAYQAPATHTTPRTQPDPYANYPQTGREHQSYATPQYSYPQHAAQDSYRQPAAPPPQHGYAAPRYFGYFDPHFLVYR